MSKVIWKERTPLILDDDSIEWRLEVLCNAGVPDAIAAILASDVTVNTHFVTEMIDNGCDPILAADIAASESVR